MNAVVFYSNTGECKRIAEYFAEQLGFPLAEISNAEHQYENAVLVFPVHCQNVPQAVTQFLHTLSVRNLTLIAAYGKMCHGNVLYEIQQKHHFNIVAAAYVPTKHTYINEPRFNGFDRLRQVVDKTSNPSAIKIHKSYKNPLANVFKGLRSRIGVKIVKKDNCDNCGLCQINCPQHAIANGKTNHNCIRCLKCVADCPKQALTFKTTTAMTAYLKNKKQNELVIYV